MSKQSSISPEQQVDLNSKAAAILGLAQVHVETVMVRPIDHREIAELTTKTAYEFRGYTVDEAGFLVPATFTRVARTRNVAAAKPGTGRYDGQFVEDRDEVVGIRGEVNVRTDFGNSDTRNFFSSDEAEEATRMYNATVRGASITECFVDASGDDPASVLKALAPVFGSKVTASFIVEGISPDEVQRRVEAALATEFGQTIAPNRKIQSRPVANRRVDVFSADGERRLLATGILAAEVSMVMAKAGSAVSTQAHTRPLI
jgi:hypothetical protein